MKKHIVVAAGLAVLSTGAFATVARMNALNQDAAQGSYYIDDERNVFRSAGAFSGNYAYFEHGTSTVGAGDAFNSGFSVGISEDKSIEEAIALGITAASISTQYRETIESYPKREEVDKRLTEII